MRLISLQIHEKSDPNHLVIGFDDGSPLDQTITTAIVGQNGSGKSQLLESLVLIFRDLDLGRPPACKYELTYSCREHQIAIDADPHRPEQMRILVDDAEMNYAEFVQDPERRYLPSYVIGYQAGPSPQMAKHFSLHEKQFYQALLEGDNPFQQNLTGARMMQSHLALLPFFQKQDPFFQQLLEKTLGIEGLIAVLPVVRELPWTSQSANIRLWDALEMAQQFLNYTLALAPVPVYPRLRALVGSSNNQLSLPLQDEADWQALERISTIQQDLLINQAHNSISKILSEARIQVEVRQGNYPSTFRDLSAGEQQLLTVLSLLHFIQEDEALFLLDGPDTYLHPEWCLNFLEYAARVMSTKRSHILMTSHNPLTISSLEPNQVRILWHDRKTGKRTIYFPSVVSDPPLLTFTLDGEARPAYDLPDHSIEFKRAQTSIAIYHLNHYDLKEARQSTVCVRIEKLVKKMDQYYPRWLADRNDTDALAQVREASAEIKQMIHERAQYSAAAIAALQSFRGAKRKWINSLLIA